MSKRQLDSFFLPLAKKSKIETATSTTIVSQPYPPLSISRSVSPPSSTGATSEHPSYAWPIPHLPRYIAAEVEQLVTAQGKVIDNEPDLDLLYFQPFIPSSIARDLFEFLRSNLPFYRVSYPITRFGKPTVINTPRYTTVFGIDESSRFATNTGSATTIEPTIKTAQPKPKYKCSPRPIPACLDLLRTATEAATNTSYNICLVNYYASGADSISYHSDDEHFLGPDPAIASFSLGARRDFLLKHKSDANTNTSTIKLPLASGDMIVMRGRTQANWLHSIPKRQGQAATGGRINITLRKALVPAGTENYYRYNVGDGPVFRWDDSKGEMVAWRA